MAYASVNDMVARFGAAEMIRASTPDGAPAVAVVDAPIQQVLDDASATIDTYLRKRYQVPLDVAPAEIARACQMIARVDLGMGGERTPSDQALKEKDVVMAWLRGVADGKILLDLQQVATGEQSFATMQTRPQVYNDQAPVCGDGYFTSGGGGYGFSSGPL